MLIEKRRRFEEEFNVVESERLMSTGWVQSFLRRYGLKEVCRHGEAASVDMEKVTQERARLAKILEKYAPRDQFNFDETGLYPYAPPDRGLASKQMSGKKTNKFRMTIGLACNADGSEKLAPFYIGKSRMPRCFKKVNPALRGFYYRANKTAWMTADLFEEWLKNLDQRMRHEERKVILLLDNFSGHTVTYQPRNVQVEFFEPNMTLFVQPMDAGAIRTFKALYRHDYCVRAVDLDEAGELDIYKLDQLEAMMMTKSAWERVDASTLKNCWTHTGIQLYVFLLYLIKYLSNLVYSTGMMTEGQEKSARKRVDAWEILRNYAHGLIETVPMVEEQLRTCLGESYKSDDWMEAIGAILHTEDNVLTASELVENLRSAALTQTNSSLVNTTPVISQLQHAEENLMASVDDLKRRRRIHGTAPTLDELLNPVEEQKDYGGETHLFQTDKEIIAEVHRRFQEASVIEVDSESDNEMGSEVEDASTKPTLRDSQNLCTRLETLALEHAEMETALTLIRTLRKFRGELFKKEMSTSKQTTLPALWVAARDATVTRAR
ncbi:PDC2 [Sanghuangporus sanghuang]